MKRVIAYRFVVRAGSVLAVLFLLALRFLGWPERLGHIRSGDAFAGGCLLLLLYPLKGENPRFAAAQSGIFLFIIGVGECLPGLRIPLWSWALPLLLAAIFRERKHPPSQSAMGERRWLYAYLVLALKSVAGGWPLAPLYLVMYILAYSGEAFNLKAWLGRIHRRTPKSGRDRSQMNHLFGRVESLLEKEKPFLDPDYKEGEMARALFTNRVYLSQTINVVAGVNFKTLLNTYRVRYAIALMNERPAMNIKQIASHSGFNSSNVFITSFKMVMGENPQKYLSRMRAEGP